MVLSPVWRKLLLLLHVLTSVGFAGSAAAFLCLAVAGLAAADPVVLRGIYIAAWLVTWGVVVPLAWATLLIGVLQALGTQWRLLRHYWVIFKLGLTLVATIVLMLQAQTIGMVADMARQGDVAAVAAPRLGMVLHAIGGIAALVIAMVLSIYKPRGLTPWSGAR